MNKLSVKPVAFSLTVLLSGSYILCVTYGLIFSKYTMYKVWEALLPGFTWLTWTSFFLGLVETVAYGFYMALVFVPLYNYFNQKYGHRYASKA